MMFKISTEKQQYQILMSYKVKSLESTLRNIHAIQDEVEANELLMGLLSDQKLIDQGSSMLMDQLLYICSKDNQQQYLLGFNFLYFIIQNKDDIFIQDSQHANCLVNIALQKVSKCQQMYYYLALLLTHEHKLQIVSEFVAEITKELINDNSKSDICWMVQIIKQLLIIQQQLYTHKINKPYVGRQFLYNLLHRMNSLLSISIKTKNNLLINKYLKMIKQFIHLRNIIHSTEHIRILNENQSHLTLLIQQLHLNYYRLLQNKKNGKLILQILLQISQKYKINSDNKCLYLILQYINRYNLYHRLIHKLLQKLYEKNNHNFDDINQSYHNFTKYILPRLAQVINNQQYQSQQQQEISISESQQEQFTLLQMKKYSIEHMMKISLIIRYYKFQYDIHSMIKHGQIQEKNIFLMVALLTIFHHDILRANKYYCKIQLIKIKQQLIIFIRSYLINSTNNCNYNTNSNNNNKQQQQKQQFENILYKNIQIINTNLKNNNNSNNNKFYNQCLALQILSQYLPQILFENNTFEKIFIICYIFLIENQFVLQILSIIDILNKQSQLSQYLNNWSFYNNISNNINIILISVVKITIQPKGLINIALMLSRLVQIHQQFIKIDQICFIIDILELNLQNIQVLQKFTTLIIFILNKKQSGINHSDYQIIISISNRLLILMEYITFNQLQQVYNLIITIFQHYSYLHNYFKSQHQRVINIYERTTYNKTNNYITYQIHMNQIIQPGYNHKTIQQVSIVFFRTNRFEIARNILNMFNKMIYQLKYHQYYCQDKKINQCLYLLQFCQKALIHTDKLKIKGYNEDLIHYQFLYNHIINLYFNVLCVIPVLIHYNSNVLLIARNLFITLYQRFIRIQINPKININSSIDNKNKIDQKNQSNGLKIANLELLMFYQAHQTYIMKMAIVLSKMVYNKFYQQGTFIMIKRMIEHIVLKISQLYQMIKQISQNNKQQKQSYNNNIINLMNYHKYKCDLILQKIILSVTYRQMQEISGKFGIRLN